MTSWQVPFSSKTGNHLHYVDGWTKDVVYKDPYIFRDTLEFVDYQKGRSRVTFIFKSLTDGRQYETTLGEFVKMCKTCKMTKTETSFSIRAEFGFKKAGTTVAMTLERE